jgi:adenosyl cobinamide kinase/adenosyl cobinamide phosphate guanylyltransferase
MQIEVIGCTSAGKSTFIQKVLNANQPNGFHLVTSYDFVLNWAHLSWVKQHRIRMFILNLIALLACVFTWQKNYRFYRFALGVIKRLPDKVSLSERIKIARLVARNIGIFEIVHRSKSERQVILADEGTLHIAHYLFVHVSTEPDLKDLATFNSLVSLPDVAVYIRQPESVLVSRTGKRGHKRIPSNSTMLVNRFIKHGLAVFEQLIECSSLEDRLVIINNGDEIEPGWDHLNSPQVRFARKILELHSAA